MGEQRNKRTAMNDGVRWHVYGVVAAILILTLAVFWPDRSDRDQHRDISTDTVNMAPVPASKSTAPTHPVNEVSNPFASSGFDPLPAEPAVKTGAVRHEPPVLTHERTATDWSQWRKPDERLRSYLGGPPGPGKPAE